MKDLSKSKYLDEAVMEMEADELSPGTDVGFNSPLDLLADNVRETRTSLVVEGLGELGIRGSK